MGEHSKPVSKSRGVLYRVEGPFKYDVEPLLKRALRDSVITQYDDGRGALVWFEGPAGSTMRKLRRTVEAAKEVFNG